MGSALPLTQAGGSGITEVVNVIKKHLSSVIRVTPVKIKKKLHATKRAK